MDKRIRLAIYIIALTSLVVHTWIAFTLFSNPSGTIGLYETNQYISFLETLLGVGGIFGITYLFGKDVILSK